MDYDDCSLNQLYGKKATVHIEGIRMICRSRVTGLQPDVTRHRLRESLNEISQLMGTMREKGAPEETIRDLQRKHLILEWTGENTDFLHSSIKSLYVREHSDGSDPECPYERDPSNRQCWGCKVPVEVYRQVEEKYMQEMGESESWQEAWGDAT